MCALWLYAYIFMLCDRTRKAEEGSKVSDGIARSEAKIFSADLTVQLGRSQLWQKHILL